LELEADRPGEELAMPTGHEHADTSIDRQRIVEEDAVMARRAKPTEAPAARSTVTRKRLSSDQKAEIARALARGESGAAIAEQMGVSVATVYAQRRKGNPVTQDAQHGDSPLRRKLVTFAVRLLLGQEISQEERAELEREVRDELVKRVAAGI
jgi:hypothetical protein